MIRTLKHRHGIGVLALLFAVAAPGIVAAAPTSGVTVDNTDANPVPVRDVGEAAKRPYQFSFGGNLESGAANGCAGLFTIPADRRLVIEHITLNAIAPSDQDILFYLSITNGTNSNYVEHTIAARREPGRTLFVASDSLKAYGAPGTQACVAVRRMNSTYTGNVIVSYSLSGYLVTP